ncbi:exonuclease [Schaalia sp. 19OD2882]|uniref:exonuclease domain-containing protein n=1 Tax=Schaalia sp. 19OD2882 TaxID=2794089 RepID=UPI001C1ED0C0|nr:exonuclease domain-containing protein [Schaalia sp. 19OD2882]QWW18876.1 exonuclease [Schaalia sp. 19OD2882]
MRRRLADDCPVGVQVGLDRLGTDLADVEWVVVDLETTGLGAQAGITEIGAVRVRGGRVLDEFHTMVDPGHPIPPRITALTGIADSMVVGAPSMEQMWVSFAQWAGLAPASTTVEVDAGLDRATDPAASSSPGRAPSPTPPPSAGSSTPPKPPVLVAHNAAFDMGFLRRAARAAGHKWPKLQVVDTLALARLVLPRPMVANHRLGTLAAHFATSHQASHRALGDARTTSEVLTALVGLMAPVGVSTLEDLTTLGAPVPTSRRRRVSMAENLPRTFGTYRFVDEAGVPLYIGSATNIRSRVRSYFTASETRAKVRRMLDLATDVKVEVTSTLLEARVAELRDIHDLRPLFNSASTRQDAQYWVVLEAGRLKVTPLVDSVAAADALGPFGTHAHADRAKDALSATYASSDAGPLLRAGVVDPLSALAALGALRGEHREVLESVCTLMGKASDRQDFEGAARWREALSAYVAGVGKRALIRPVASAGTLVWAFHRDEGGWTLHRSSWGRLTGTVLTPPKSSPMPWVEALIGEEPLPEPDVFLARTTREETSLLAGSLLSPGARLVHWGGPVPWAFPVASPLGGTALLGRLGVAQERPWSRREGLDRQGSRGRG